MGKPTALFRLFLDFNVDFSTEKTYHDFVPKSIVRKARYRFFCHFSFELNQWLTFFPSCSKN